MLKLLVDECLSDELVKMAIDAGHLESSHVRWQGKGGFKDWELMPFVLDGDWTLVTNNSFDFRGDAKNPGTRGYHAKVEIHAGLICLNWDQSLAGLEIHRSCFELALNELPNIPDMVNKCLEVSVDSFGEATITLYDLP